MNIYEDYFHISGGGTLNTRSCECEFYAITPLNEYIPVVLLLCIGVHMHPPAYSDRTPQDLKQQLLTILQYGGRKAFSFGERSRLLTSVIIECFFRTIEKK